VLVGRRAERRREIEEVTDRQILLSELKASEPGGEARLDDVRQRAARLMTIGDEIEGEPGSAAQLVLQSGTPSIGEEAVA
jgi:hypothetical protein